MQNKNDIDVDLYQRFIQKLEQIDINLHGLQQGYEKKLRDNPDRQNLESKIKQIILLKAALLSFCKNLSWPLFNAILDEILRNFPWLRNSFERAEFSYKTEKCIKFLNLIKEHSENLNALLSLLDEISLVCDAEENFFKNSVIRLKHFLVLTAIEKQEGLEEEQDPSLKIIENKNPTNGNISTFSEKKHQLENTLENYYLKLSNQNDYRATLQLLSTQFLDDPYDCLTPYTINLLKIIYNSILDNAVKDRNVTDLLEEIVGEEVVNKEVIGKERIHPKKSRKRLFSDDEKQASFKTPKLNPPKRQSSPIGIALADLADISLAPDQQLPKVRFKLTKKNSLDKSNHDASDKEDNALHCQPVK